MAVHQDNMAEVSAFGELVSEGWKRARVSQVVEKESSKGFPIAEITFTIQEEGSDFGRTIRSWPSLQAHALGHLKAIYKACNYEPGPEGHDPEKLIDNELYIKVQHEKYEGNDTAKIPGFGYRSLTAGAGR